MTQRLLVIGLDAFEVSLAEAMIDEGKLPNLRRLRDESARFLLDHGRAKYTGLGWEHFSSGKTPELEQRWSAVHFDRDVYSVTQDPTSATPFLAAAHSRVVVFDVPYFDLARAPGVRGISSWGAHDPGVASVARPDAVATEFASRFGAYPAPEWIYGFSWPSVERTKETGRALTKAVEQRSAASRWLFGERLPNWELGIVVVSESHSAIEPLWHGIAADHPLHGLPSAAPAAEALRAVYEAIDRLVGDLAAAFPDAALAAFSMHGMGSNEADLPAMVLLPELLFRHAFGQPYAREWQWAGTLASGAPVLAEGEGWDKAMSAVVPWPPLPGLGNRLKSLAGKANKPAWAKESGLAWMPTARYAAFWPRMPAFALPAYYDAQIRLNLDGREAAGMVPLDRYEAARAKIAALVEACRDPVSGEPAVANIGFSEKLPLEIGPTEADIYVTFRPGLFALDHPTLGRVGPYPFRRTGGHSGEWGFLWVRGDGIESGERGAASSFDVAPTILDWFGEKRPTVMSGESLKARLHSGASRSSARA